MKYKILLNKSKEVYDKPGVSIWEEPKKQKIALKKFKIKQKQIRATGSL